MVYVNVTRRRTRDTPEPPLDPDAADPVVQR